MRRFIITLSALAFTACATGKKAAKNDTEEPDGTGVKKQQSFRPSDAIAEPSQKQLDPATQDFQSTMQNLASDAKQGGYDYDDVASRMSDLVRKHPNYGPAWFNLGF